MACYHPQKILKLDTEKYLNMSKYPVKNGIMFVSKDTNSVQLFDKCSKKIIDTNDFIYVPCQNCVGCRMDYAKVWANRCCLEALDYTHNYFITLTYDSQSIPYSSDGVATLFKRDLQLFLKRLRKHFKKYYNHDGIRFFACGEYGSEEYTQRPHYHIILFNCPIPDLTPFYSNFNGDMVYTSQLIFDLWQRKGFVVIGDCDWRSCAYVGRYVMKKHKGKDKDWYFNNGLMPEFCTMSRKPGIGYKYYDKHKRDIYDFDSITIATKDGHKSFKPPRYFDNLFALESPEQLELLKERRRKVAEYNMELELSNTDLSFYDYLGVKEKEFLRKASALYRKMKVLKGD